MELIYTAIFLASLFLFFLTLKIINTKYYPKEGGREAPGPWNLPFVGSLHHMLGSNLPHRAFRDLSSIYGPVMSLKLGEVSTVVVSSAEAAREIMKTHDIVFATRPINYTSKNLFYGGNTIAFSPYGEYWRQMRRICNMELLSAKRVCSFRAVREEELCRLIRSISASSGTAINFSKEMAEISSNIMARAAIGGKCGDKKMFYSTLSGVVELSTGLNTVDLFPSFPFIGHITGYQRRLERCQKELDLMAENNIREHAEKMIKRSTSEDDDELLMEDDFTDVLLRIQRQGSLPFPLTNEKVKAVVNDMLFGGSETTSTLMEWIMSELIQNPNIMKKVQSEVREAFGSSGMLGKLADEEATSGRLKYLQLVIQETLRLHPPAPLLLPRESQERCEVMGYDIPAKTTVIINMWAIARDARHWVHPDIFWPERFEESSLDFRGNHLEFMPFGAGRRICPGMQFALAMVETVMSHLLYYFDWEYLGKKLDMGEAFGLTTRREFPLCIVPTIRYPLQPSA